MTARRAAVLLTIAVLAGVLVAALTRGSAAPIAASRPLPTTAPTATVTPAPPSPTPTPDRPATLRIALPELPDSLDPLHAENVAGQVTAALLFAGLTRIGADGRPHADLAGSWQVAGNGTRYTFLIRPAAHWSDGTAVTAADVVFTVSQVKQSRASSLWSGITVELVNAKTVRFHVPAASAGSFLSLATLPLLPEHLLGTGGQAAVARFASHPVGAGPFTLTSIGAQGATLERAVPRQNGRGNIGTIDLHFASGPSQELRAVEHGTADVAIIPFSAAGEAATAPHVVLWKPARAAETLLLLNVRQPPLDDARVRQAISLAIDRAALVRSALGGLGRPMANPLPARDGTPPAPTGPQIVRATALLEAAGWRAGSNGVRFRQVGNRRDRLAMTLLTTDTGSRLAVARQIASQLRPIGMAVTVEQVGTTGLFRDFLGPGRYQSAVVGLSWDLPDTQVGDWWQSSKGVPVAENLSGIVDPVLDAAITAAQADPNPTTRAAHVSAFTARFEAIVPAVPLYQPVWLVATTTHLHMATSQADNPAPLRWGWEGGAGDLVRDAASWRLTP